MRTSPGSYHSGWGDPRCHQKRRHLAFLERRAWPSLILEVHELAPDAASVGNTRVCLAVGRGKQRQESFRYRQQKLHVHSLTPKRKLFVRAARRSRSRSRAGGLISKRFRGTCVRCRKAVPVFATGLAASTLKLRLHQLRHPRAKKVPLS